MRGPSPHAARAFACGLALCAAACSLFVDLDDLGAGGADAGLHDDASAVVVSADAAPRGELPDAAPATPPDADVPGDGGPPLVAEDTFDRVVDAGLGAAPLGGPWTLGGATTHFWVSDGAAHVRLADAGYGPSLHLRDVAVDDADVTVRVATEKLGGGSGLYVTVIARQVERATYGASVVVRADGVLNASLVRRDAPDVDSVTLDAFAGALQVAAREPFALRVQASGRSPTTLRAKIWRAAAGEPAEWLLETVDGAAALQAPGTFGLGLYLSSSATNAPYVFDVDDFRARGRAVP